MEYRGFSSDSCCYFVEIPWITEEGLPRCNAVRDNHLLFLFNFLHTCDLNIVVNHISYSYFVILWSLFRWNYFVDQFKNSFFKMPCRALWNTNSDESFHCDVLSKFDSMYSTKESENKGSECIFCNGKFTDVERREIWSKCFCCSLWTLSCTVPQQRTQSICVTFINIIEVEMFFV